MPTQKPSKLILLRHGESCWNQQNIFTGWVDIPLTKKGIDEALESGRRISNIPIDIIFTSTLIRAQMTTFLAFSEHHSKKVPVVIHSGDNQQAAWSKIYSPKTQENCIPVIYSWELNERMYGDLQGLNKAETAKTFGAEQVKLWRRSYDIAPPGGESLAMTAERSIPYFKTKIIPLLNEGQNVFVCAHGNSLRSICMHLDNLSHADVIKLEIPTGIPLIYNFSKNNFTKVTQS